MTPPPTPEEFAAYLVLDSKPDSIHFGDFISAFQDGLYNKERPSDYVIGMLLLANKRNLLTKVVGDLMQVPFTRGMKIRQNHPHVGHPFLDPNGDAMMLDGPAYKVRRATPAEIANRYIVIPYFVGGFLPQAQLDLLVGDLSQPHGVGVFLAVRKKRASTKSVSWIVYCYINKPGTRKPRLLLDIKSDVDEDTDEDEKERSND